MGAAIIGWRHVCFSHVARSTHDRIPVRLGLFLGAAARWTTCQSIPVSSHVFLEGGILSVSVLPSRTKHRLLRKRQDSNGACGCMLNRISYEFGRQDRMVIVIPWVFFSLRLLSLHHHVCLILERTRLSTSDIAPREGTLEIPNPGMSDSGDPSDGPMCGE